MRKIDFSVIISAILSVCLFASCVNSESHGDGQNISVKNAEVTDFTEETTLATDDKITNPVLSRIQDKVAQIGYNTDAMVTEDGYLISCSSNASIENSYMKAKFNNNYEPVYFEFYYEVTKDQTIDENIMLVSDYVKNMSMICYEAGIDFPEYTWIKEACPVEPEALEEFKSSPGTEYSWKGVKEELQFYFPYENDKERAAFKYTVEY